MSRELRKAIKLREWTRRAVARTEAANATREDWEALFRLNRLADEAYAKLDGLEVGAYSQWCWSTLVDDPQLGSLARRTLGIK